MVYRAVALSQVDGSGAESIGRDVAQQLGFGYLNEAIVAQAAKIRGVDPAMISDAEQRKSLLSRLAEMALRNCRWPGESQQERLMSRSVRLRGGKVNRHRRKRALPLSGRPQG